MALNRKKGLRPLSAAAFLLLTFCILTHSKLSLYYALTGLKLWFEKMIPTLLPFMILTGVMVRMDLTEYFVTPVYPLIRRLFRVSRNVCYVMIMGFLCGFPMGAKCVSDLYLRGKLSKREAEYLLAFCNNIGPVYFCGFVMPLLGLKRMGPYLFGMYGLPLLYGLILRFTRYRDIAPASSGPFMAIKDQNLSRSNAGMRKTAALSVLEQTENAIDSALQSIQMLGGYMILFNLLNLPFHLINGGQPRFAAPLLEISGGLQMLGRSAPLYSLLALPFGGFSCIAQTYSCIRETDLSIRDYVAHKLALTLLTGVWYSLCGVFSACCS